jgi:hypothetical protein
MCVIFSCPDSMPTLEQLELGEKSNPHGGGYATLIKGKLSYRKGLTAKEIHADIKKGLIQNPCIIHFRIKSVGIVTPKLTHPFEISDKVELNLEGKFNEKSKVTGLFFHNGTIQDWKTHYFNTVRISNSKMLKGEMSDSRAFAFIVSKYGHECLDYIDPKDTYNRYAVLDMDGIHTYGSWTKCGSIMASNDHFEVKEYDDEVNGYGMYSGNGRFYNGTGLSKIDYPLDEDFDLTNEVDYMSNSYDPYKAQQKALEEFSTPYKELQKRKKELQDKIKKVEQKTAKAKKKIALGKTYKPKYRKRDRKADIRFLREYGWKNPEALSNNSIQKEVEAMQINQATIKKVREKIKDDTKLKMSYKEYQMIQDEVNENFNSYVR